MLSQDYWEDVFNNNGFKFEDFSRENLEESNEKEDMKENENLKNKEQKILYSNMDNCSCGNILIKNSSSTLICNDCGTIRNSEDDNICDDGGGNYGGYKVLPMHRKIRIIGEDSAKYRSDLFRCGNATENELQTKRDIIFDELENIHERYLANDKITHKIEISKNNLKDVAIYYTLCIIPSNGSISNAYSTYGMVDEKDIERYTAYVHKIQNCIYQGTKKRTTLRSANKKETLAALLSYVCLSEGYTCPKSAISEIFQLEKDGFASGEKYVRFFISQKKIDLDLNISRIKPEINTLFNAIGEFFIINEETIEEYEELKKAICVIHDILEKKYIAERSCVRSQIIGTSYIVIKRCKNKKLIPQMPDIVKFCSNRIRKSTVEKFIIEINSYHSYFLDVYNKFNLDNTKW